jgi:hypothetical protein
MSQAAGDSLRLDGFPAGTPGLSLSCRDRADSTFSAYRVFSFARDCGMKAEAAWEAATAAAQLTSTLVRFAGSGTLLVRWLEAPRAGLQMVASHEAGPTTGSAPLAQRLGSVRRLLSELSVDCKPCGTTRVVGHKWAGPPPQG